MRVTFLAHSGFFVELEGVCLLFDWWKGELPPLPEKPLLIFVSHWHEDHFSPAVFSLNAAAYIFGNMDKPWLAKKGASADMLEKSVSMRGSERCCPLPGVTVETLPSTDEGVAFVVECGGKTVYHAGDLHWWHWDLEPDSWNSWVEEQFKGYTAPLRDRQLDLAFLLLDPRQQHAADWGFRYLLDTARIRRAFPMHQWEDYAITGSFLARCPQYTPKVVPVSWEGQRWIFDD